MFPAHRLLLSAHSPVLRRLLASLDTLTPVVFMFGCRSQEVASLLTFLYTGAISIPRSEVASFLRIAQRLEISGLGDHNNTEPQPPPPVEREAAFVPAPSQSAQTKNISIIKKYYSKEGVKKVQNALSVNHVLKVEVNEEERDRAAANNAFEFVPVNEAPASPPPSSSPPPGASPSPALSELPEERTSAEHSVITDNAVLADVGTNKLQFRLEESDFAKYPNYRAFLQSLSSRTEQGGFRCGVYSVTIYFR